MFVLFILSIRLTIQSDFASGSLFQSRLPGNEIDELDTDDDMNKKPAAKPATEEE